MITVTGELARQYQEYRDLCESLGDGLSAYRQLATERPNDLDAASLAAVLRSQVRFSPLANSVIVGILSHPGSLFETGEIPPVGLGIDSSGIEVKPSGRVIISACRKKGCRANLDKALLFLFFESHPKVVEVDTEMEALPEEETGSEDDVPDEAPEGWET